MNKCIEIRPVVIISSATTTIRLYDNIRNTISLYNSIKIYTRQYYTIGYLRK